MVINGIKTSTVMCKNKSNESLLSVDIEVSCLKISFHVIILSDAIK